MFDGLTGQVESDQRGGAGAVDGQRGPGQVEDVGHPVGCDAHGQAGARPMVDHAGVHVCSRLLVVPVHQTWEGEI